jgi:flagellar motility protein MotE (MotC chaperone)
MTRIFQSSWFVAFVGCLIYLGTTAMLIKPSQLEGARKAEEEAARSADDDPSWRFRNPELDQWINELRKEKESLALREQQVKELESRVQAERQEIYALTQSVHQLQADFDRNVTRLSDQEVQNLKREIKVYGGMAPDAAARLLSEMSDDQMVRVLFMMKADQTGAILEALSSLSSTEAKRAARITERMRRTLPPATAAANRPS